MTTEKRSAVIDRIVDGAFAVLVFEEGERSTVVPVGKLPSGSSEGTWLLVTFHDGELLKAELDLGKTEEARARIKAKRELLLQRMKRRSEE